MPPVAGKSATMDRFTEVRDLGASMRRLLARALGPLGVILTVIVAITWYRGLPGTGALAMISVGTMVVLFVWRDKGLAIPLVPMLAVQHLIAYGLPIVVGHDVVAQYPEAYIERAGLEVLVFSVVLAVAWRVAMGIMKPSSHTCYAVQGIEKEGMKKLETLGFNLVMAASAFQLLLSLDLLGQILSLLPTGSDSLINVLISALNTCGFFLAGLMLGKGEMSATKKVFFWTLLAGNCFISASGFLLSSAATFVFSVLIGLIWGSGRIPWRYIVIVLATLSFLSAGKYTMRTRYWNMDENSDPVPQFTLGQMPARYLEWIEASLDSFSSNSDQPPGSVGTDKSASTKGDSLLKRVNNLQNLLFVIEAMDAGQAPPLYGATYALIPPLLVPRILWPDKPRSHEGQVLLNVHFGRQDLGSTFQTYVAWGLLPEAYGNFGPIGGAIFLGIVLGIFCAWVENLVANKLVFSLEGFLAFTVFLGMMNSFEMVASVLVTSVFQAVIPVIIASMPFVERMAGRRAGSAT